MKPNDKAIEAAILAIKEIWPYYTGSKIRESMAKHLAKVALPAAYAAQFQSEEYAGLIERFRSPAMIFYEYDADQGAILRQAADAIEALLAKLNNKPKPSVEYAGLIARLKNLACELASVNDAIGERFVEINEAADALEALLAERDDFEEQIALRSENGISKDLQEFLRKFKEDDSAAIRMFAQYRDLEIEMDSWKSLWEKTNAHMRQVEAERDALAARLAPVEYEALAEIAAKRMCINDDDDEELIWSNATHTQKEYYLTQARAAIAAIRPHIEAAERERSSEFLGLFLELLGALKKVVATHHQCINLTPETISKFEDLASQAEEIAAAIRSGK